MPQLASVIVLGSLLAFYGNELPDPFWSALLPLLVFLSIFKRGYRLVLLAVAAYLWAAAALHNHLEHRLLEAYDQRVTLLRAEVADIPEVDRGRVRLSLINPEIDAYPGKMPRRLLLNWYQDKVIPQTGERWLFQVKLRQPRGHLNPGGFDYEAWLFGRGIDASGYIRDSVRNRRLDPARPWRPGYWRMRLHQAIDASCDDCPHRGLIKALALGFRGDISATDRALLQASGTAHLLAISGLHVGMVGFLAFAFGRMCWQTGLRPGGLNRIQMASTMAILAACGYAALAGFSLPTVRALIMLLILLLAHLLRSRVNLLQSLSLAVIVIVVIDPRSVASNSFWLSVGALLVIAFVQFRWPGRLSWWRQLLALQCCFSLLFTPLGLLIFEQVNPASFPANIVAIPVVSFIVLPTVLLACLFALVGVDYAGTLFRFADGLLQYLLDYLGFLLSSGLDPVAGIYPGPVILMVLALVVWLLLPRGLGSRSLALIGLSLLLNWQPARPEYGSFDMIVFDVGMGTSVLLNTRHHSLVYDFGPGRRGVYSAADWGLRPAMLSNAVARPDLAIVSHVDQDHSGGLHGMLDDYPRLDLISGTPGELRSRIGPGHEIASCHDYPGWRWDGIGFRFLPTIENWVDTNNRSCVLLIEGRHRVLLTGDIESARERNLLTHYAATLAADVLLVPHHGSDTSSSSQFVARVAPRYVIHTMSRGNRWGFPSSAVMARYAGVGAQQYRTDLDGAVSVSSNSRGLSISGERSAESRIWRRW